MTSGPSWPLRPFTVGYRWTNHASLSLESSQHIYKFLPEGPYLVRHQQQYVSGTRSGSTTSPRSFPSDQLSSERKKGGGGGGGHIRYNQVFRSLSQDLGIPLPSRCKVFLFLNYQVISIKDLFSCH